MRGQRGRGRGVPVGRGGCPQCTRTGSTLSEMPTRGPWYRADPWGPMDHILPTQEPPTPGLEGFLHLQGIGTHMPGSLPTWGQVPTGYAPSWWSPRTWFPRTCFQPGSRQEDSRLQCSEVRVCAAVGSSDGGRGRDRGNRGEETVLTRRRTLPLPWRTILSSTPSINQLKRREPSAGLYG